MLWLVHPSLPLPPSLLLPIPSLPPACKTHLQQVRVLASQEGAGVVAGAEAVHQSEHHLAVKRGTHVLHLQGHVAQGEGKENS